MIKFHADRAMQALAVHLAWALLDAGDIIAGTAKLMIVDAEVEESFRVTLEQQATSMAVTIANTHWRSFIWEYGSGSLMDPENPGLAGYIGSALWNPARPSTPGAPIMGRPKGSYVGLAGPGESTGRGEGKDLEQQAQAGRLAKWLEGERAGTGDMTDFPHAPSHPLRTAMEQTLGSVKGLLAEAVKLWMGDVALYLEIHP